MQFLVPLVFCTRAKRTDLMTEDLDNFEKELEKIVIEIYTPGIAFTESI